MAGQRRVLAALWPDAVVGWVSLFPAWLGGKPQCLPCMSPSFLAASHASHIAAAPCACCLQGPLVGLAPRLAAYTRPGGLLGLSGEAAALALPLGRQS